MEEEKHNYTVEDDQLAEKSINGDFDEEDIKDY